MSLRERLRSDVRAVIERDPATERALEVLLTSPGLYARWSHRLAGWLWNRERRLTARTFATITRLVTGIEIHPGAQLGERVVIDHGQGTVIGATATVGDDVLCYHGVTLGAREAHDGKRHPTIGDGVTLGANATVLGDLEVGDGVTVGAGAVVTDPVATGETVVGVPARPVDEGDSAPESTVETTDRDADDRETHESEPPAEVTWARQDACDERPRETAGPVSRR